MNIFYKRPLALILCIGIGGFFLFTFEKPIIRLILIALGILPLILSIFLNIGRDKKVILRVISVVFLTALLLSHLYFDNWFKAYERYDEKIEVVGIVEEKAPSSSYSIRLRVRCEKINDKRVIGYNFYAYVDKTEAAKVIDGTRIRFNTTLSGFSDESKSYNFAKGINAYAQDVESLEVIEHTNGGIKGRFAFFKEHLSRYAMYISDSKTGAILAALLLGERDYLPDSLRLDFKRIGISHILALSGMHLSILSLGLGKALSLCKVKKKTRIVIICIFVLLYMALTGFSVSVVRAGLMLIISSLLFLLSRTKDSVTSLTMAVTIICIITPYAIFDISLWLSALATLGIIVLSEYAMDMERPITMREKIFHFLKLSFLSSMFAISATLAISTVSFGGFSLIAPLATIIFSILSEIIMYLGCIMMLIGWLVPIGKLISPLCRFMSWLASLFSEYEISYVSTNFKIALIAVIIYSILFYLFVILNIKKRKKAVAALLICFFVVMLIPTISTAANDSKETVAYCSDNKCDEMLIRSKNEVCLINSSQYSKGLVYTSIDFLKDAKVTYLDIYYLTHYSWSLDDDVETLTYNIKVDKIYLPEPRNGDEETILKLVSKSIEDSKTTIILYKTFEKVSVGEYDIQLLHSTPYGETSMNAFAVSKKDVVYLYISSGLLDGKTKAEMSKYIGVSDVVILGKHGKQYKNKVYITECYPDIDTLVFNSTNVFLKQNNMKYYMDRGCGLYSHHDGILYFVK